MKVLPALKLSNADLEVVELRQRPGDVVAFPAGWWHAVVNLDATITVTESFGERHNLEEIVTALRAGGLGDYADVMEKEVKGLEKL